MPKTHLTEARESGPLHIFIATSAYSFHANYTHSLAAAAHELGRFGIPVDFCHVLEHCHVDDARNAMVRQFILSNASHLVFIDNDVGFAPDNLVRLAQHDPGEGMIAGVYPLRDEDEGYPVRLADGVELWSDDRGLVEVEGLPTGFLRLSRACIEQMIDAFGERKFYGRGQSTDAPPNVILFERTFKDGVRYSGDYAFCEKWKSLGGKMFVDPEMTFTHAGVSEWRGNLGDYWRRQFGITQQRFDEAVLEMQAGDFGAVTALHLIDGWGNRFAADVNTLITCWHAAKNSDVIVECGSGLTTLVMALANPDAEIIALESEPEYAIQTRETLGKYQVDNVVVRYAPIVYFDNQGKWYSAADIPGEIDLLLIDGPNRKKGDRWAALDIMHDAISGAFIVVDDAKDEALMAHYDSWAQSVGRTFERIGTNRETAISTPKESA